jgi:RNA polymerase sigma factor (sigma-70 family)
MTGEATLAMAEHRTGADADRLGALFDAHHHRLYRLARRLASNPEDARDLVQEAFVRAARQPRQVPDDATREEAWLVQILVNLCRDRWRRAAARERLRHSGATLDTLRASDPEAALVAQSVVWHALDTLPPRRRAVLIMYELEGCTVDVIARTLGVTPVTVRWHLSRGRRQMAVTIRGVGNPP